jgi:diguanylate cyclase (GGDEF)-like protein
VICIDTDSLKQINDSEGHDAGDRFLLDVTRVLRETVRGSDLCSRWGGDEFAVIAENLSERGAQKLGERIRRIVEDRTDGTLSVGIFCGSPASAAEALKAADGALYEAKKAGKNRVVVRGAA